MIHPQAPLLVGLDWPAPRSPAFILKATAPARDGDVVDAVFVAEGHVAVLLLTDRAAEVLGFIQAGILRYLTPLGCDPAEVTWWTEPIVWPPA